MTTEALAEKSGLSMTYIYLIESGQRQLPLYTLIAIAEALDTTASDLLSDAGL